MDNSTAGNDAIASQEYNVEYLVVAGGGSGGSGDIGGGAGAGGMRFITATFTVATGTSYPITVGGGGAAVSPSGHAMQEGINGSNSTFSTISSTGGGGGGGAGNNSNSNVRAGGSGGGGGYRCHSGGAGNTPPVSPHKEMQEVDQVVNIKGDKVEVAVMELLEHKDTLHHQEQQEKVERDHLMVDWVH